MDKKSQFRLACIILALWVSDSLILANVSSETQLEKQWHQWRGPHATGVAPHSSPPTEWGPDKNIRWKTEIPGLGHATPIIWDETIFVTTAIKAGKKISSEALTARENQLPEWRRNSGSPVTHVTKFVTMAINRHNGQVIWQKTAKEALPHEGTYKDASWASPSAITDGQFLFAYFGSFGLYCYDFTGQLQWETDFGDMDVFLDFGEGSSPALHDNTLFINWDHQGQSFIIALDKQTGKEKWRTERDEISTWTTPVAALSEPPQVIVSANNKTCGYDVETGGLIWSAAGLTKNTIPSPVFADGIVYVASGYDGEMLQAIRAKGASGDVTDSDSIVWQRQKDAPYVPSLLLYGDMLYALKSNKGIVSCFDAKTGKVHYGPERLKSLKGIYASPVAANGKVYFVGRQGNCLVLKHSHDFEILAENRLEDRFDASPAIVGDQLYLRGHKYLYCISE